MLVYLYKSLHTGTERTGELLFICCWLLLRERVDNIILNSTPMLYGKKKMQDKNTLVVILKTIYTLANQWEILQLELFNAGITRTSIASLPCLWPWQVAVHRCCRSLCADMTHATLSSLVERMYNLGDLLFHEYLFNLLMLTVTVRLELCIRRRFLIWIIHIIGQSQERNKKSSTFHQKYSQRLRPWALRWN